MPRARCRTRLRKALKDGTLQLPEPFQAQLPQVKEVLRKLAGKLDIKNADERRSIKTRQAVLHSEEFKALWDRIKHKTTYRVQFDNEKLVTDCAEAIRQMPADHQDPRADAQSRPRHRARAVCCRRNHGRPRRSSSKKRTSNCPIC